MHDTSLGLKGGLGGTAKTPIIRKGHWHWHGTFTWMLQVFPHMMPTIFQVCSHTTPRQSYLPRANLAHGHCRCGFDRTRRRNLHLTRRSANNTRWQARALSTKLHTIHKRVRIGIAFANSNSSACVIGTANFERAPHLVPTMVRIP